MQSLDKLIGVKLRINYQHGLRWKTITKVILDATVESHRIRILTPKRKVVLAFNSRLIKVYLEKHYLIHPPNMFCVAESMCSLINGGTLFLRFNRKGEVLSNKTDLNILRRCCDQ